jgi:hypothetical protein
MKILFERDRYSISELVLLGIFVLGILASWAIVTYKPRVNFSAPVPLPFTGLSVSLPAGEGWWQLDQWKYDHQNNSFVLAGEFQNTDDFLQWEYLLAEPNADILDIAKNNVAKLGGALVGEGSITNDNVTFAWAQFARASRDKEGIVGVAGLSSGRHLKIIILTEDEGMLQDAFEGAVASIKYKPNELLEQGLRFVRHLKSIEIDDLIRAEVKSDMERIYIVRKVVANKDINAAIETLAGFAVERFTDIHDNFGWTGIKGVRLQYINSKRGGIDQSNFECDKSFNEFVWQNSRQTKDADKIITEIKVTEDGWMSIGQKENVFLLSGLSIPEILVESAARAFIDYGVDEILIDVITHKGWVIPTIMSKKKLNTPETEGRSAQTEAYGVTLTFLYTADAYEKMFFSSGKEIVRKISKSNELFVIKKSSWEELHTKFAEWSTFFDDLFPARLN